MDVSAASPSPESILGQMGIHEITSIEVVTGGRDTKLWRVNASGTLYALRVFRPEQAETLKREIIAMRLADESQVRVPEVVASTTLQTYPALLLSWCEGRTLYEVFQLGIGDLETLAREFGSMLARIHSVPFGSEPGPRGDWFGWQGTNCPELRAWIDCHQSETPRLLHLDYHPLNVMVEAGHITSVLDWANAHLGDPRADVARTMTLMSTAVPEGEAAMRQLAETFNRLWLDEYQRTAGALEDMPLFYLWAGLATWNDLVRKPNRDEVGIGEEYMSAVRNWVETWERETNIHCELTWPSRWAI